MIRVRQIFIDIEHDTKEEIIKKIVKKLKIKKEEIIDIKINKKSLDARKKNNLHYVYEIDLKVKNEDKILKKNNSKDIFITPEETYEFEITGTQKMNERPIIVGAGPAGLFAAYMLAENGYHPLIIERGEKTEDRIKTVEEFWKNNNLNEESNVQFGEGGAGTFSDGKLNTLVKDKNYRMKKAFEIFVECGAPKEILYINNPHIGTDNLRKIIINMRNKIIEYGGEFRYNTKLTNIIIENNQIKQIEVNNKELINCENLILAIGHSARDTFEMLSKNKMEMSPKPFAVGVRVIHNQELINNNQYGKNKNLPSASYKLTYQTKEKRGVYSFCMCPGGYVVNSSSEKNHLVINGMSNYKRDTGYANSAIVVTVSPNDFDNELFGGVKFQRKLEQKAYEIGKGKIPMQTYENFKNNKTIETKIKQEKMLKGDYMSANLNEIFPNYITASLKEAIEYFDTKIPGFKDKNTLLLGVETRTSSPIRINRDETYQSNIKGIYPCGEGSGYAGGITTSAMDGIKISEQIAKTYKKDK